MEQQGDARRRRRRRRRGGRGRDGEQRETAAEPTAAATPAAPSEADDDSGEGEEEREGDAQQSFGLEGQTEGQPQAQPGEGGRRRRRRRRGRRGGRDSETRDAAAVQGTELTTTEPAVTPVVAEPVFVAAPVKPLTPASFFEDRYGQVDEIDTTPRDEPVRAPVAEAIPNAASTPVWSLESPRAEPEAPQKAVEPAPVAPTPTAAIAPTATGAPERPTADPAVPTKKGWWQRAFRAE